MTSNKKYSIIERMAKLREQKRITKALDNFFGNTGYSNEETRRYRMDNINTGGVPVDDFLGYLEINNLRWYDKIKYSFKKNNFSKKTAFILGRRNKINKLYKSCLDDGFIEPAVFSTKEGKNGKLENIIYIRVSKRGSDLIHLAGFWEEVLKKYPTQKLIVNTIITTLFSTAVLVLLIRAIWLHF